MESANLESVLEVLGLQNSDVPQMGADSTNLYCSFGSSPVAKLYTRQEGFKLRFGDMQPQSTVDFLPSGGIRVKPALLPRAQYSA